MQNAQHAACVWQTVVLARARGCVCITGRACPLLFVVESHAVGHKGKCGCQANPVCVWHISAGPPSGLQIWPLWHPGRFFKVLQADIKLLKQQGDVVLGDLNAHTAAVGDQVAEVKAMLDSQGVAAVPLRGGGGREGGWTSRRSSTDPRPVGMSGPSLPEFCMMIGCALLTDHACGDEHGCRSLGVYIMGDSRLRWWPRVSTGVLM